VKKIYRVAGKTILAGLTGNALFVASLFLMTYLVPPSDRPDVVEGWGVAFLMIIGMLLSIFLSGVIGVLLTFKDISRLRGAILVSFFSGAITTIIPLLIGAILGMHYFSLFLLCLSVIIFCDILAIAGGILIFLLLSYLRKRKIKRQTSGQV
jgi:hypothetical protein